MCERHAIQTSRSRTPDLIRTRIDYQRTREGNLVHQCADHEFEPYFDVRPPAAGRRRPSRAGATRPLTAVGSPTTAAGTDQSGAADSPYLTSGIGGKDVAGEIHVIILAAVIVPHLSRPRRTSRPRDPDLPRPETSRSTRILTAPPSITRGCGGRRCGPRVPTPSVDHEARV